MKQRIPRGLVPLLLLAIVGACGAGGSAVASPTARVTPTSRTTFGPAQTIAIPTDAAGKPVVMVWMGEHYYSPAEVTIPTGTTVMWRMLGAQDHDVWAYDGSFHSPTMGPGATFTHTFTTPGTFKYFCAPHYGDGMTGAVIVTPR